MKIEMPRTSPEHRQTCKTVTITDLFCAPSPPLRRKTMRVLTTLTFLLLATTANAANVTPPGIDQPWGDVPREVLGTWFQTLHREGGDTGPCCGLGDAYEADIFETEGQYLFAIITDGREFCYVTKYDSQAINCRKPIPEGTRFYVPPSALVHSQGNPTGHGVVFVSQSDLKTVFCFVTGAGG